MEGAAGEKPEQGIGTVFLIQGIGRELRDGFTEIDPPEVLDDSSFDLPVVGNQFRIEKGSAFERIFLKNALAEPVDGVNRRLVKVAYRPGQLFCGLKTLFPAGKFTEEGA